MEEVKPKLVAIRDTIAKLGGKVHLRPHPASLAWSSFAFTAANHNALHTHSPTMQQPKYFWVDWPQGMERVILEVSVSGQAVVSPAGCQH